MVEDFFIRATPFTTGAPNTIYQDWWQYPFLKRRYFYLSEESAGGSNRLITLWQYER